MFFSKIVGTGGYLPEKILTNFDLEKMVDTSDAWIVERTGIRSRHIAAANETTSDLAEHAARRALDMAGLSPHDLDLIILATTTPDKLFPSTACLLQERLGVGGFPAFDVQAVCTGFLYALATADKFIQTGGAKNVLVVGAETFSRLVDWTDRNTCVLFGDGAGAVVLSASDEAGILSTHLHADGRYHEALAANGHVKQGQLNQGDGFTFMRGQEVFKFAVKALSQVVAEALEANQLTQNQIDWLVPHQANKRIIDGIAKKLQLPSERVVVTVDYHGNTSAASVPLALDVAVRDGRIQRGDTLLLEAMGGGFTWGSALLVY